MEIVNGIIRKIVIGDIKNGITYVVGQPIMRGKAKISAIVQDEMYFIRYKMLKFNIYIKWKVLKHQSCGKLFLN